MDLTADFTLGVVVATLLLAGATIWLVLETRKIRKEEERHRKELAFRAAILELSRNIIDLTPNDPSWSVFPNISWNYPMQFPRLLELMESVWIDTKLWERITQGSLVMIKTNETLLHELVTHTDANQNPARDTYHYLDIYLKQLIRYVFCEMQRQKLTTPSGIWDTKVFQPLAYIYGDLKFSSEDAARLIETGKFRWLPPELDDEAFHDCRFEVLITEARQAVETDHQRLHQAFPSGIVH